MKQFERSLMLSLALRENTRDLDEAAVMALKHCKGVFDNVVICVPSWQEVPSASDHPLVRFAIATLADMGVNVVWGRKAFITWNSHDGMRLSDHALGMRFHDAFKWEFWYELLRCIHDEREDLCDNFISNVVGTFINTEPDGPDNPMLALKKDWQSKWWLPLFDAAYVGKMEAGKVATRVSPCSRPEFASALTCIGKERDERKTYYTKPPFDKLPDNQQFEWWNTLVSPDGKMARGSHVNDPLDCSTPAEAMQFDDAVYERLRESIPGLRGHTIYAHITDVPRVLEQAANLRDAGAVG